MVGYLSEDAQALTVQVDNGGRLAAFQVVRKLPSGPTSNPVLQSISMAGSNVTLSWMTQNIGTYRIWRKTDLSAGSWSMVVSNFPSGIRTADVTVSGADGEFYQIKDE